MSDFGEALLESSDLLAVFSCLVLGVIELLFCCFELDLMFLELLKRLLLKLLFSFL